MFNPATFSDALRATLSHVRSALEGADPDTARRVDWDAAARVIAYSADEALDTPFHVEALAAALVFCVDQLRVDDADRRFTQPNSLDANWAGLALRGERYLREDGENVPLWDPFAGIYELADGSRVQLHTNFPEHRDAALRALRLPPWPETRDPAVVRAKLLAYPGSGADFEAAVLAQGGAAALVRGAPATPADVSSPPELLRIVVESPADAARPPPARASRSLAPRVLDSTRVLAGPSCTQTLADLGLDVVSVTGPGLAQVEPIRLMTGRWKRSVTLGLDLDARASWDGLFRETDVWIQSFRPTSRLASSSRARELNPSLVRVDLRAYHASSAWAQRRGYDSLVQCATGLFDMQSRYTGNPSHLPVQALDHCGGLLATIGALAGLRHRAHGRGVRVTISLEGIANFMHVHLRRAEPRARDGLARAEARLLRAATRSYPTSDGRTLTAVPNLFYREGGVVEGVMGGGSAEAVVAAWRSA